MSSIELENVCSLDDSVREVACIAVNPAQGGPSLLVIVLVCHSSEDAQTLKQRMQKLVSTRLNPLFRIHDVVQRAELPRTASGKVMRRVLRREYVEACDSSTSKL